jgi:Flp pilus assembly protein CpaB
LLQEGVDMLGLQTELTQAREVESVMVPTSTLEDAEGHVRKVALLDGEPAAERQAQEVAEEKLHNLSNVLTDGMRRLVVSEMEH